MYLGTYVGRVNEKTTKIAPASPKIIYCCYTQHKQAHMICAPASAAAPVAAPNRTD